MNQPGETGPLPTAPWSDENLTQLAETAGDMMLTILDTLARHPSENWGTEAFGHIGLSPGQTSGAVGAISRAAHQQFGRVNPPHDFVQVAGFWHWVMQPAVADRWRAIRGLDDGAGEES